MAVHTVFGNNNPSYPIDIYTESGGITLGNVFHLTGNNGNAIGWRTIGGRVYIPNDARVTNKSITIMLYTGDSNNPLELAYSPLKEVTTTTPVNGGWCEVYWDEPILIDYGPHFSWSAIVYTFNNAPENTYYVCSAPVNQGPASGEFPSLEVGSSLVLADNTQVGYKVWKNRGVFKTGNAPTITENTTLWYATDIIVDTGRVVPPSPTAAYGFNEASGTEALDSSGNNHNLTVSNPVAYTLDGHKGAALTQISGEYGINDSMPWIDTGANSNYSLMFWGKIEHEASLTDTWTVRQTIFSGGTIAIGLKMSDGINTVLEVFVQGVTTLLTVPKQNPGEWHHYAIVTNAFHIRLYIDGVLVTDNACNGTIGSSGGTNDKNIIVFGGDMQGQSIDDLRIFDIALQPSEVQYYMMLDIINNNREGKVKVWNGTAWVAHPLKRWNGTTWEVKPIAGSSDGETHVFGKN